MERKALFSSQPFFVILSTGIGSYIPTQIRHFFAALFRQLMGQLFNFLQEENPSEK